MRSLVSFFEDLQKNKRHYVGVKEGKDLEAQIGIGLHKKGITRLMERDIEYAKEIKKSIDTGIISNPTTFESHYWMQPRGSQNYPDFIIFAGMDLICIETKFSKGKQNKPVWNSGLPRQDGIYIFGSKGLDDITFFMGKDVISKEDAKNMHEILNSLQQRGKRYNKEYLSQQPYGFAIYIRKAFEQKVNKNPNVVLNFFKNPNREKLEASVIDYCEKSGETL